MTDWTRALIVSVAIGASLAIVAVTPIRAQDLSMEWLSVRAAVDGVPQTTTAVDLAERYGVLALFDNFFPNDPDPGTPAHVIVNLPLLLVAHETLPAVAVLLTLGGGILLAAGVARLGRFPFHWAVAGLPILLLSHPGMDQLNLGQFSLLVASGLTWSLVWMRDRAVWWATVPLGVAVGAKLYLWLVIPALWFSGRRRDAAVAAGTAAGLNLVGLLFPGVTVSSLLDVAGTTSGWSAASPFNGSLVSVGVQPFVAVAIGLVVMMLRRDLSVAVPLSILVSPIAWIHYLPAALVPALGARRWWLVGGLAAWWMIPRGSPQTVGIVTLVSLMVLTVAAVMQRQSADSEPTSVGLAASSQPAPSYRRLVGASATRRPSA